MIRTNVKDDKTVDVFRSDALHCNCKKSHEANLICLSLSRVESKNRTIELEDDLSEYQYSIKDWMIGHSNRLNLEGKTPMEIAVSIWKELYENNLLTSDVWLYAKRTGEIE